MSKKYSNIVKEKPNEKVSGMLVSNQFELQHHDSLTKAEIFQDNIFGQVEEEEKNQLPTFKSPEWAGSKPKATNMKFLSKFKNRMKKESN